MLHFSKKKWRERENNHFSRENVKDNNKKFIENNMRRKKWKLEKYHNKQEYSNNKYYVSTFIYIYIYIYIDTCLVLLMVGRFRFIHEGKFRFSISLEFRLLR